MRTRFPLMFLMLFSTAMAQQRTTVTSTVSVKVEGRAGMLKDGTVIKFKPRGANQTYDVLVRNGQFSQDFKGIEAELCTMTLNEKVKSLFLTPGVVKVNIPDTLITKAIVTGNIAAMEFEQFFERLMMDKTRTDWAAYSKLSPVANSQEEVEKHNKFRKAYYKRSSELALEHIKANPKSAINTYLLYSSFVSGEYTEDDVKNT